MDFGKQYDIYLNKFNEYLKNVFESLDENAPSVIREAMNYAVSGGGKRVRPILCIATAEALGLSFDDVKELALSIEIIHSYSLVHDDLPAMDNDDYRRGKLSTHKKYGEANGILAGDALLTFAFEHCLAKEDLTIAHSKALLELAKFAGYSGMVGGQVLDLENENNQNDDLNTLFDIVENKTAKLIIAPLVCSAIVAGGKYYNELFEFGYNLGFLFQITDDILDVEGTLESIGKTPHKDAESNKLTFVKFFGLEGAKVKAKDRYDKCLKILNDVKNAEFLIAFTDKIYSRKN